MATRTRPHTASADTRHSSVSLLSDCGVPLEEISGLVGHSGTAVTEEVYRKQIRPVIQTGAVVMDGIFKRDPKPWQARMTSSRAQSGFLTALTWKPRRFNQAAA